MGRSSRYDQRQEQPLEKLLGQKGIPESTDAERFVLGSILLDGKRFVEVACEVTTEEFHLEKHRRIFNAMTRLHDKGATIDRMTVAEELSRVNELASVDGLTYISSIDDGLPHISNLESYCRILADKSERRKSLRILHNSMSRILIGEEETHEIFSDLQQSLMNLSEPRQAGDLRSPLEVIAAQDGGINAFLDPGNPARATSKGLTSGFPQLDDMTGGLKRGELTIIAARPAMGKSAIMLNIAWHVATKLRQPVAIFSLEMRAEALLARMLCAAAHVDSMRFHSGFLNEIEGQRLRAKANDLMEAPLYIDDSGDLNMMDMEAKLKRKQHQTGHKIGLVCVDYLQLMEGKAENRVQEVSKLSRGMKLMAKRVDAPFIVLSQLSRATETRSGDHRPQLSDLRESGSIEQDADVVGFIFREEVYKRDREDLRGVAELILAKQREGPIGTVDLVFLHGQTRFESRSYEGAPPPE